MDTDAVYSRARARVERLRSLYVHVMVFIAVNAGLALFNLATSPGTIWFIFPLIGWGIALAAHALSVFGGDRFLGPDWEERQIREELARESGTRVSRAG